MLAMLRCCFPKFEIIRKENSVLYFCKCSSIYLLLMINDKIHNAFKSIDTLESHSNREAFDTIYLKQQ